MGAERAKKSKNDELVPRSRSLGAKGIHTSRDFTNLMGAIMSDVLDGSLKPEMANAVVNAGGKMLKCVEMSIKHGTKTGDNEKVLMLTDGSAGQ